MFQRLAIALCLALLTVSLRADEPGTGSHVVIVLDCSRHMAGSLAAAAPGEPSLTRLAAAREAVSTVLRSLAGGERHTVTLVLFGHRVASQSKEGRSVPVAQLDYLRLTDGKLERLQAGQDVEIVRESRPLTSGELDAYQTTLGSLKPWGEAPLLLAIERAVELSPQERAGRGAQVVVLTSGRNEPTGVKSATSKEQLIEIIRANRAAVSIVQVGAAERDAAVDDLRDIAHASGGTFYAPSTAKQVTEALRVASRVQAPLQQPGRIDIGVTPQPVAAVFQPQPAPPPADDVVVPVYDVVFDVTYYEMPVKDAEVIIRGPNFDLVYDRELEYKIPELRANRTAGRYIFQAVPEDAVGYTVEITANVKNRTYKVLRGFSVDYDNKAPGRSFKIQLEKSKEPPVAPGT